MADKNKWKGKTWRDVNEVETGKGSKSLKEIWKINGIKRRWKIRRRLREREREMRNEIGDGKQDINRIHKRISN